MKIILFMATSLNGIIASKEGNEDFLSHTNWKSFSEFAKKHGCFIIGRKTYSAVSKWPNYNFNNIEAKLKIVVSNNKNLKLKTPFLVANSPKDAIQKATNMNFKSAILVGGSTINSSFLMENLIDEVIINIESVIIGDGISLFKKYQFEKRLSFISVSKIENDILQVRYKVNKH